MKSKQLNKQCRYIILLVTSVFVYNSTSAEAFNDLQNTNIEDLRTEYNYILAEKNELRQYNDEVQKFVDIQKTQIASMKQQMDDVATLQRGVESLMYNMIETLEKFIAQDIPIDFKHRKQRITELWAAFDDSELTTADTFRLIRQAYETEMMYGTVFVTSQGEITIDEDIFAVDYVQLGRLSLLAQSLDKKHAWVWNKDSRLWNKLGEEYQEPLTDLINMAQKRLPMKLTKLPISAVGEK